MEGPAWMSREPGADFLVLVSGVVVENDMDHLPDRDGTLQGVQEADELLVSMALHVAAEHFACQDVQGGEQCGRAMPLVVMSHSRTASLLQRQAGLGAVKRLDLSLLINAQHDGVGGRHDVEPENVM